MKKERLQHEDLKEYDYDEDGYLSKKIIIKDFIKTILVMTIATGISVVFEKVGFNESNIILVYILGVLFATSITYGYFFGILSSVIGVLSFNFFFTHPLYTFLAYRKDYPMTFCIMLMAAIITSTLTSRIKREVRLSHKREKMIRLLYENNKTLLKAKNKNQIIEFCGSNLVNILNRTVIVTIADENNNLGKPSIYICNNDGSENIFHSVLEKEAIKEAFRTGNPVGIGTKYCKNSSAYYFPIKGQESNVLGVIGVACFKIDIITENEKILLEAVSTQVALAIDRENLFEKNKKANLEAERERLRGNLLRSISHDLRTQLTSILGSSSTILENDDVIDKETRVELLKNIYEDTSWLTHSVENILSMTRIDEGKLDIEKRPEVVDEIIAESILRVKKFANSRDIKTNIPDEIIIVHVDVLLIEQVLVNLIDNAIRHTPKNSKIELTVKKESNQVLFEVADNGKGIPNEDIGNIFNRFYTKNKSRNLERRGIGLGLEICKSIVEAHGGEIVAFNNPSGGATFRFSIPMYDEEGKDKWK